MTYKSISFHQKFGLFSEQWQPKVIAEMNDYQFKVVKCRYRSYQPVMRVLSGGNLQA